MNDYHVICIKEDDYSIGYSEEEADRLAKQKLAELDGCLAIVVKYIRVFNREPRVRVHELSNDCVYFE